PTSTAGTAITTMIAVTNLSVISQPPAPMRWVEEGRGKRRALLRAQVALLGIGVVRDLLQGRERLVDSLLSSREAHHVRPESCVHGRRHVVRGVEHEGGRLGEDVSRTLAYVVGIVG